MVNERHNHADEGTAAETETETKDPPTDVAPFGGVKPPPPETVETRNATAATKTEAKTENPAAAAAIITTTRTETIHAAKRQKRVVPVALSQVTTLHNMLEADLRRRAMQKFGSENL